MTTHLLNLPRRSTIRLSDAFQTSLRQVAERLSLSEWTYEAGRRGRILLFLANAHAPGANREHVHIDRAQVMKPNPRADFAFARAKKARVIRFFAIC